MGASTNACPPGLECLVPLPHLFVKEKVDTVDAVEAMIGITAEDHFLIKNQSGEILLWATEISSVLSRTMCCRHRPFKMVIMDKKKREVILMKRPFRCNFCCSPCSPCCLQVMEVLSATGDTFGSIKQKCSVFRPQLRVFDASGDTAFIVKGPCCTSIAHQRATFKIFSSDGKQQVGTIRKSWAGFTRESFSGADHFGILFPENVDVKMKAVLLGVVILIHTMYF